MAQTWTANCFATTQDWDASLQAMEDNHLALQSNFSGSSAPTSPVAGQGWTDTTNSNHKRRNAAATAWIADLHGDASFKIPVYRNDTCEGWDIDTSVTDRVIALKGGSGAYNANGGTNAGTAWATLAAHVHSLSNHNHQWYDANPAANHDFSYDSNGDSDALDTVNTKTGAARGLVIKTTDSDTLYLDLYTDREDGNSGASNITDPRMAAALCTLQYPDLT